jgi:hypothetical protein
MVTLGLGLFCHAEQQSRNSNPALFFKEGMDLNADTIKARLRT